jgi:WD40 repeat protein/serine/threonine protein kinase
MNTPRDHLLTIFGTALEYASLEERQAYLDQACASDLECRARVEALLRAHEQAGNFLQGEPHTAPFAPEADTVAGERAGAAVGPYRLVRELGEGGMGTVWLAEQTEPIRRQVALKVIKPGMDSKQVLARFEAERQALALMDHPNIAHVLDAGATPSGRPYFVMELVQGVPITRYCDENHLTPRERLALFVQVCRAVQHAHQKGIIHRDLKPSNVLVAPLEGRPVVKVIDFGVAKAAGQPLTDKTLFTGFGAVVGTLEYMSPEQAELNNQDIDTRSDVYALGVMLYELLTGSTPLTRRRAKENALLEVLRLIREEDPPRPSQRLSTTEELPAVAASRGLEPRKLSSLVYGELDWIVMKALEKDRTRRYESANGLAQDLERHLADEPVAACPPSLSYRLGKFARRNKVVLATAAVVAVAVMTAVGAVVVGELRFRTEQHDKVQALDGQVVAEKLQRKAEQERADKEKERADTEKRRADTYENWRRTADYRQIALSLGEYKANNLVRANEMLADEYCPVDLRGWEWHYLKHLCAGEVSTFKAGVGGQHYRGCFSSDGSRLAVYDPPYMRMYETATGKETLTFEVGFYAYFFDTALAFSPDSRLLAISGYTQWHDILYVWDTATGANLARLYKPGQRGRTTTLPGAAFSPDGRLVAATDPRGNLCVWDLAAGWGRLHVTPASLIGQVVGAHASGAPGGAWLPTLAALAQARTDPFSPLDHRTARALTWVPLPGGKAEDPPFPLRFQVAAHPGDALPNFYWYTKLAFSPDGKLVATASGGDDQSEVKLWDAQTGEQVGSLGRATGYSQVVFSPGGKWVAALGSYQPMTLPAQAVWVWDVKTRQLVRVLSGEGGAITSLAFSPDEQLVATGHRDGTLSFWDVRSGMEMVPYRGHGGGVLAAAFSSDGKRLMALGNDRVARVWDAQRSPECIVLRCRGAWQAAFSGDGRHLVAAGNRFSDNRQGTLVWDIETLQEKVLFGGPLQESGAVALSPDGNFVASCVDINTTDGLIRICDLNTNQQVRSLPDQGPAARGPAHMVAQTLGAQALAPAGGLLGGLGQSLAGLYWDGFIVHAAPCDAVAWSADGRLIATGGQDRIVRIWDARTGKQLRELSGHARTVSGVAFSRDGKRLVSASGGIERQFPRLGVPNPLNLPSDTQDEVPDLKIWDVDTGKELRSFSLPGKGPGMALSPDGETVAATFGGARLFIHRAFTPGVGGYQNRAWILGSGNEVRLYRTATGAEVAVLKGHTQTPWCVTFSPDGQRVVTSGADSTLKVWDAATGEEIMTIGRHPGLVTSVAFSPDGLKIVSTTAQGDIRVWDATPRKK